MTMMEGMRLRYRRRPVDKQVKIKNIWKIIRTLFEILFCLAVAASLIKIWFFQKEYEEADKTRWTQEKGFVAISYSGVSEKDSKKYVSKDELEEHLKVLHDSGYVSIGIQDIINYYNYGRPLPEKALVLIFEDGRRDSFIFAQPLLEKYNFKALMFTYASYIKDKDSLYLGERDIGYLQRNSYWEIGSNGYRFSHINVYKKETEDVNSESAGSGVSYTHYLMDYLRDEDGIPLESKKQMQQRITLDYDEMNRIYEDILGYQPDAYMIMHANALFNNMNPAVEEINLENIFKYFKLMFNREGSCSNTKEDSIYNLTRLRVKPGWTGDRLLLEIDRNIEGR